MLVLRMVSEQFHRDTEDRPLREGRTPRELLRDGDIEYRRCPYAGSRAASELPMNASALRQTSAHWDDVIDAVAFLREAYANARGGYRADVLDIWRVGQLGSALPWFFILRERTTCPAYAAALSKVTLGVGIWAWRVLVKMLVERSIVPLFTSQMILDTAEETGTLISDYEVCAASDKMILKFFDAYTAETVTVAGTGEVAALLDRRDDVLRFGAHYLAFKQWLWMYWLARRALYDDLIGVLGARDDLVERMDPSGDPSDFSLLPSPPGLDANGRAAWFGGLATLIQPFAADKSDGVMRDHALALARIVGEVPARIDELAAEVARVNRLDDAAAARVARVLGTYAALDGLLGDVLATVESGFGGASGATFDAAMRDRVISLSPRELMAKLAPTTFAQIARP
jgi:hypothetical protein